MSKEQVTQHEERLRAEFKALMKQGKSSVKKLIEEAEEYLMEITSPEGYEESALIALQEVKENRRMYFQHYSIIKNFVDFQRKLNKKDSDDDYIIF
jgi:Spy/CpxP family protein refolding chaperone